MNKEKISIAILNRNGLDRLKKIIPSIINQDYNPMEIIIFDNGSTDDSLNFINKFNKIRLVKSNTNLGYGKAKNKLVRACTGKYILMLDNDIELKSKNTLSVLLKDYKTLKLDSFISPLVVDINKNKTFMGLYYNKTKKYYELNKIIKRGLIKIGGFRGNTVFFKKNLYLNLGGYDEIYPFNIDDYDLSARGSINGYQSYVDTNTYVIHHGIETRNSINSISWKNKYYLSGFSRMIWKNYKAHNIVTWWPISVVWIFYKSLRNSFKYLSLSPINSYFLSFFYFLRDLKDTLEKRAYIQKNRTILEDNFLKINLLNVQ